MLAYHSILEAFNTVWSGLQPDSKINPNSVDIRLHKKILIPRAVHGIVDPFDPTSLACQEHVGEFVIRPNQLIYGSAIESFDCSGPFDGKFWVPQLAGRSTVARLGLEVHLTAGFGDYGFSGSYTLEIKNNAEYPIRLHPGMRIAQVYFVPLHGAPEVYSGAYSRNHSDGPVPPKLGKDRFE